MQKQDAQLCSSFYQSNALANYQLGMRVLVCSGISFLSSLGLAFSAIAQVVSDGTLPVPTRVTSSGNDFTITDGTQVGGNLFHSFSQFSIPTNGSANFNTAQYSGIQNIFSRITGGSISTIDGVIRSAGSANLFLLNPSGIIFGPNAKLEVGGSFLATTANSMRFADGTEFSTNLQAPSLLTVSVPIGVQFGSNTPGGIRVDGSELAVEPGKTFGLLGGEITIIGGAAAAAGGTNVLAPSGRIELGSVGSNSLVGLTSIDRGFALSYNGVQNFQPIQISQVAYLSAEYATSTEAGGDIQVQGRQVQLTEGSQIGTSTMNGTGGSLTVNATERLELLGTGFAAGSEFPTALISNTRGNGTVRGVTVNTPELVLRNGAQIQADTRGNGQGGNVTINATNLVELDGVSPSGQIFSAISAASNPARNATGRAGNLVINTARLNVKNGGQISVTTFGNGQGGNLAVNAADIQLTSNVVRRNGLFAQAGSINPSANRPTATGQGGNLSINTNNLLVQDGSSISTATFTAGNAGNLAINAKNSVQVVGRSGNTPSLLTASSNSAGAAGNLSVSAQKIIVKDGGEIAVSATGTGVAGNLQVSAPFMLLDNQGVLTAETKAGQGNITVRSSDLRLRRNSLISTNATGPASGGNITIATTTLVALENSDITANSQESFGGRVSIAAGAIFGTAYRTQLTPQSDITATSALGPQFSGLVTIQTPSVDPSQGLVELQTDVVDVSRLVVAACSPESQKASGEFFITGRGGLPPSPVEGAGDDQVLVDLGKPVDDRASANASLPPVADRSPAVDPSRAMASPLLQAQGWMVNTQGKVVLVAQSPTAPLPISTGLVMPPCKTP